jgi:hypothetical protein
MVRTEKQSFLRTATAGEETAGFIEVAGLNFTAEFASASGLRCVSARTGRGIAAIDYKKQGAIPSC